MLYFSPSGSLLLSHITEQLLARSLRISESVNKSVRPGICVTRFSPRLELLRLRCLCMRLTEARVVTWKTSRTLFSDTLEEHSTYATAPSCRASMLPCGGGGNTSKHYVTFHPYKDACFLTIFGFLGTVYLLFSNSSA